MGVHDSYFYGPYIPHIPHIPEIWERKFVLWPRKCQLSKKILWFTFAYRCVKYFREDIQIFIKPTNKWHSESAHTFYLLKGR